MREPRQVLQLLSSGNGRCTSPIPEGWNMVGISTGVDVLAYLAERGGSRVTETYTVTTSSGGMHYFRAPKAQQLRNTARELGWLV